MVEEKQKAEEKEEADKLKEKPRGGLAQAAGPEPGRGLEPSTERRAFGPGAEVWPSRQGLPQPSCQPEKEVPSVEKAPAQTRG